MAPADPTRIRRRRKLSFEEMVRANRHILSDISVFSRLILNKPLYEYQLQPVRQVIDSVIKGRGLEFLLVFPRQSGKNEAVAQLTVYLMNLFQRRGGNIVFGARGDGLGRGIRRLEQRLENPLNRGRWQKTGSPNSRILGNAAVIFISTHPATAARGETADWLLVIDEMQDQSAPHLEAVFEPMRAANNATGLYIGTVKSSLDALWQKKQQLERRQEKDGLQRVFIVSAGQVVAENPKYGIFLAGKIERLGRKHPIVASEYFNEPLGGDSRLFDRRRLALMRGDHRRGFPHTDLKRGGSSKQAGDHQDVSTLKEVVSPVFVGTLDVGGVDEATTDVYAALDNPGRDYTAAHIFSVELPAGGDADPIYRAVDVFVDQGSRHFQASTAQPGLAQRLLAWFEAWNVIHVVADDSGVGAGLVDWLKSRLGQGRVTGYTFSRSSKARLGVDFLSLVETGRFKYWSGEDEPLSDGWWFFAQAQACRYSLAEDGRLEQDLRWSVPAASRVNTPEGSELVHDDRLVSAALVSVIDGLWRERKIRLGSAASAIIPPVDPLDESSF